MIKKELQRVDKTAMKSLEQKDVLFLYPQSSKRNTSMLVLKKPKTESSIRKVFIPATVAHQLESWKREQERTKEALGGVYTDYNLILANGLGHPMERTRITALLNAWKVPDSQETSVSGINLSLLKKISENPDLLKILSAIVGSL